MATISQKAYSYALRKIFSIRSCSYATMNHLAAASSDTGPSFISSLASTHIVHSAETLFCSIHNSLHLPWWAVIMGTTFALRTATTLPLAVHQAKMVTRVESLMPLLKEMQEAVMHRVVVQCRKEGLPVDEANRRIRREVCSVVLRGV